MATQLDLANAQLVGFVYAKKGFISIIGLIEGMGLTKKEWIKLKENYSQKITDLEVKEIDKHFGL